MGAANREAHGPPVQPERKSGEIALLGFGWSIGTEHAIKKENKVRRS
jgi:hypothetical protein